MYLLGLSLAAALLEGLFRHSPSNDPITVDVAIVRRNRAVNVG